MRKAWSRHQKRDEHWNWLATVPKDQIQKYLDWGYELIGKVRKCKDKPTRYKMRKLNKPK